eukprot:COSAG03_NODE_20700_length_315_cov_0.717593_1_plen_75_part_01
MPTQCGAYYFGRDWTYRGMQIHGCTFELPGTMWTESWSFINAVCVAATIAERFMLIQADIADCCCFSYADDFGSS